MSGTRIEPGAPLPSLPPRADTVAPRAHHQIERAQPKSAPRQSSTAWKRRRWRWMVLILAAAAAIAAVVMATAGDSPDEAESTESTIPAEYREALRDAQGFLDLTPFSRSGLVRQLTFDQYAADAAEWAADHLDINWRDQAVRAATDFLQFDDLGEAGLREKLGFEGFTPDEIEEAVRQMKVQGLL